MYIYFNFFEIKIISFHLKIIFMSISSGDREQGDVRRINVSCQGCSPAV